MNGTRADSLPLEPLLHAYLDAGLPPLDSLGARAMAVLSARDGFLAHDRFDHVSDGVFQDELVRFYQGCVSPALHTDQVVRKARVIRHAVTHLCHCTDSMARKLKRCLVADGAYFVGGLGPSFWSAIAQAICPDA